MLTRFPDTNSQINPALNLRALVNVWEDDHNLRVDAQELKPDAATTYHRGIMKFIEWLRNERPSAETIRRWKAELLKDKNKAGSVSIWLAGLRSFFSWLTEHGRIPFDPTQAIKGA